MAKIDETRWKFAQKNEQEFWGGEWNEGLSENEKRCENYWKFHVDILKKHIDISDNLRILEIGGGVTLMINYIDGGEKYSLDPLMDYFQKKFKLKKGIKYITAKGEKMPFDKDFFDIIIITNVIDHVNNYDEVLSEIRRVLKKSGVVYLSVDCHNYLLKKYRDFREKRGIGDPAHPHTFTLKSIKMVLKNLGFDCIYFRKGLGNQGIYVCNSKSKKSFLEKLKTSLKNGGISRLLNSLIYRTLNKIGKFTSPEKEGSDFIFVLKKKNIFPRDE